MYVQETTDPVLGTSAMTKDQGSDTSIKTQYQGLWWVQSLNIYKYGVIHSNPKRPI